MISLRSLLSSDLHIRKKSTEPMYLKMDMLVSEGRDTVPRQARHGLLPSTALMVGMRGDMNAPLEIGSASMNFGNSIHALQK